MQCGSGTETLVFCGPSTFNRAFLSGDYTPSFLSINFSITPFPLTHAMYYFEYVLNVGDMLDRIEFLANTLLEKPSVTQDHNTRVTENFVIHIDREPQSLVLTDFSDRSTGIMEFYVTLVFCACVTLGIFNSVFIT
jgi:hypothetical protein